LLAAWPYLLVAGLMLVACLAFYAGKLLMQLKQQKQRQQQAAKKHLIAQNDHDINVLSSVVIIVRAMKEQQCDISEGCWRLSVLLGSLKTSNALDQQFPAIFELYEKITHMPILKQRKEQSKQERRKQDIERAKAEDELTDQINNDLEQLHQFALNRQKLLTP
jgi:hypothetical protein